MTSHQRYRTHALLTDNPEDDLRQHHVFWAWRPSYDAEKAAAGLGDIEKYEIDSCLTLRHVAHDVSVDRATVQLAALEKATIAAGGTVERQAETCADTEWPRSKLGHDFKSAVHYSAYDDIRKAHEAEAARAAAKAQNDIAVLPVMKIKPRFDRR
jgi:hypothetical protein